MCSEVVPLETLKETNTLQSQYSVSLLKCDMLKMYCANLTSLQQHREQQAGGFLKSILRTNSSLHC